MCLCWSDEQLVLFLWPLSVPPYFIMSISLFLFKLQVGGKMCSWWRWQNRLYSLILMNAVMYSVPKWGFDSTDNVYKCLIYPLWSSPIPMPASPLLDRFLSLTTGWWRSRVKFSEKDQHWDRQTDRQISVLPLHLCYSVNKDRHTWSEPFESRFIDTAVQS